MQPTTEQTTKTNPTEESMGTAAQCWCDPETSDRVMDDKLAIAFAKRLDIAKQIDTPKAIAHLVHALKTDPGYRISWSANIAMAFKDEFDRRWVGPASTEFDIHKIANQAAENFLELLCR